MSQWGVRQYGWMLTGRFALIEGCVSRHDLASGEVAVEIVNFQRRGLLTAIAACAPWIANLSYPEKVRASTIQEGGALRTLSSGERAAVDAVLGSIITKGKAPSALRLVFHDAGTYSTRDGSGGANASVQFELARKENAGLKRPWGFVVEVSPHTRHT